MDMYSLPSGMSDSGLKMLFLESAGKVIFALYGAFNESVKNKH